MSDQHWQRVLPTMQPALREFSDTIRELGGDNVLALTVFGALAAGTFDPSRQTAASVIVLGRVDLDFLRRFAEHGPHFGKLAIAAPLVMTPAYIAESCDAFPLELIEIHQNRLTLCGDDYFADLAFDDAHVRLACEREFKTMQLELRQGLLAAAGKQRDLEPVIRTVADELVRTMRGLLWLHGDRTAHPALQVVSAIEGQIARKLSGIRQVADPYAPLNWEAFESLYRDVEMLGEVANDW